MSRWQCPRRITRLPRAIPISGWVEAFVYTLAIAVLSISYVVGQQVGAHPIAFILYAMFVSAVVLLAVTGFGPDALRIMLAPQSWLVGIGTIGIEVVYYILLEYVAPAHGSLLVRLAIPLSLVVGWVHLRAPAAAPRHDRHRAWCSRASRRCCSPSMRNTGSQAPRPASRRRRSRRCAASRPSSIPGTGAQRRCMEKLRVTGLVVLVTSLASLALAGGAAVLIGMGHLPPTAMVPTAAQMLHGPTILLAAVVGSIVLTAMAALSFSAVVKITTENLMAVHAFTPVATLLVQMAATAVGLIPAYALDPALLPAMAVVIVGVLMIFYAARRR